MSGANATTDSLKGASKGGGGLRIDAFALAMEVAMAMEQGKKVPWEELAELLGSASGNALNQKWSSTKKAYKQSKGIEPNTVTTPKKATSKTKKAPTKGKKRGAPNDEPADTAGNDSKKRKVTDQKGIGHSYAEGGGGSDDAENLQGPLETEEREFEIEDLD
ncbi:hypothetical protein MMC10_000005 [Thelotrema lepadinum]|nr:hypothetical protein [Thelotrema lepadinum]